VPLNPEREKTWAMMGEAQSALGRLKSSVSQGMQPKSCKQETSDWLSFYRTLFCVGTGDLIACSGLIVILSRGHARFAVRCWDDDACNVASFFADHPNIKVETSIESVMTSDVDHQFNGPGFAFRNVLPAVDVDFFENVYRSYGVPYAERWNSCPIPEAVKMVPQVPVPNCRYMFVHDDSTRRMVIDPRYLFASGLKRYRPVYEAGRSILAFRDVIENAEQIHVIDSSFFHLCEQFNPRGALYFHRYPKQYRKVTGEYRTRHNWTVFPGNSLPFL
jgi:hypothetical protein